MTQNAFAGAHTVEKLDKLEKYLVAYSNVFKHQELKTIFFDAFAGTGEIPSARDEASLPLDSDDQDFVVGSAQRALGPKTSFNEYVFVEKNRNKAKELEALKLRFPQKRISTIADDANTALKSFCASTNWKKCRAVVFLDPFGNQVDWTTIEALAATKAVDLWYLFPAGLGVHRQIGRDATFDSDKEKSLTRIFGTNLWIDACIEEDHSILDLFDNAPVRKLKVATPDSITKFMISRMKDVFKGGVLDDYLRLGSRNHHSFSLLFAWANPSASAKKAGKIAQAVMRSGKSGR